MLRLSGHGEFLDTIYAREKMRESAHKKREKLQKVTQKKKSYRIGRKKRITGSCEKWNKKRVSLHDMRGRANVAKSRTKRIMQHDNAQEQETLIFRAKLN